MESDFPKSPRMFICRRRCSWDALVILHPLIITGETISSNLRKTWRLFLSSWMLLDSAGRHETSPCDIIAVYVRLIPQPTNGAAAFMTSQAVSRPARSNKALPCKFLSLQPNSKVESYPLLFLKNLLIFLLKTWKTARRF